MATRISLSNRSLSGQNEQKAERQAPASSLKARIMSRTILLLLVILICSCSGPIVFGDETPGAIDTAIADLSHDRFLVREKAMQVLLDAKATAIAPLEASLATADAEAVSRGLKVLERLATDSDHVLRRQALQAIERLSQSKSEALIAPAEQTLSAVLRIRRGVALAYLEERGARLKISYSQFGPAILTGDERLEFDDQWRGSPADLSRLADITDVRSVKLDGEKVTDEWINYVAAMPSLSSLSLRKANVTGEGLAKLKDLPNLQSLHLLYIPLADDVTPGLAAMPQLGMLRIYGSKLSEESSKKLATSLPVTKVDIRRGGFFGVGVQGHPLGCVITTVQPGSVANKAGIDEGDVILSLAGTRVFDFESLTAAIAKHSAGDEVTVDMFRGQRREELKIKLGEWEQ